MWQGSGCDMLQKIARNCLDPNAVQIMALIGVLALSTFIMRIPASGPSSAPQTSRSPSDPFEQVGHVTGLPFALVEHQGVLFTADGHLFITLDAHAPRVTVWDARTLKPVTDPLEQPGFDAFSLTADGKTVFTTGGGEIRLWEVATSKAWAIVKADKREVAFLDISDDGRRFIAVSGDMSTMTVWDATPGKPSELYHRRYAGMLNSAQFDPTAKYVVNKEFGGPFHLLCASTGREVCPAIETHEDKLSSAPYQAQFDPAGKRLAVPLTGGFRLLECASGKAVAEAHWDPNLETRQISFGRDSSLVAITTLDRTKLEFGPAFVFDAVTAHRVHEFGSHVLSCQIAPGGRFALCKERDTGSELFDLHNEARVQRFPLTGEMGSAALMSPDGETILVGSDQNTISVWRLRHVGPTTEP